MNLLSRCVGVLALASFALGTMLLPASPAWAQKNATWHQVNDEIDMFSRGAKSAADKQIRSLKETTGKDFFVEAIPAPPQFKEVDRKDQKAVKKFFDNYAIERAKNAHVNGVYMMILSDPHVFRVEVGNNTRTSVFTNENVDVLEKKMIAKLKEKDFDGALATGTAYVSDTIRENSAKAKPQPAAKAAGAAAPVAKAAAADQPANHGGGFNWMPILMIIGVILVVWIIIAIIRAIFASRSGAGYGGGGPGMGYGGGGGGGFMSSLLGGLVGAAAGMWMYNHFFGGGNSAWAGGANDHGAGAGGDLGKDSGPDAGPADTDYSGGGGDYGNDAGGGDAGGGDWGGDAGGGDVGGGDWGGGGDAGGGDWGGGGGGDWGGGGGDFGGGGGGDW